MCSKVTGAGHKRHYEFLEIRNVRPTDYTDEGDCTTRSLLVALKSEYHKVREEQNLLAIQTFNRAYYWNDERVWPLVLLNRGWKKIKFKKRIPRWKIAAVFPEVDFPIITHSSEHVAVIEGGMVIDIWESQNGLVDFVMIPPGQKLNIKKLYYFNEKYKLHVPACKRTSPGTDPAGPSEQ